MDTLAERALDEYLMSLPEHDAYKPLPKLNAQIKRRPCPTPNCILLEHFGACQYR